MTDTARIQTALRRWMEVIMTRSMRDWGHYIKSSGLSRPQFQLLMQLYYQSSCNVSQISGDMSITNAAASQLVDKLVQSGLLERTEDTHDRRVKQITISENGRQFIKNGIEKRYAWVNELSMALTEQEREEISRALGLLTDKTLSLTEHEHAHIEHV